MRHTGKDWVQTEHKVVLEEDMGNYANFIGLDDIIKAGIYALRAENRISLVNVETTDGGF